MIDAIMTFFVCVAVPDLPEPVCLPFIRETHQYASLNECRAAGQTVLKSMDPLKPEEVFYIGTCEEVITT